MIPTPTDCRRLGTDDGWCIFFYDTHEVFGVVWDIERPDYNA